MRSFSFLVTVEHGFHARPAARLVEKAQSLGSKITVSKSGKTADAKRLFAVMKLNVLKGDEVEFSFEGAGEDEDRAQMESFCKENL